MKSCVSVRVTALLPAGAAERPGEFFDLRLESPGWEGWRPGQFLMLRPASWGPEMIWGRPFSFDLKDGELSVFFQVVGRGTRRLADLKPGEEVVVWGPLGNGFAVEPELPTLILAGGMGLAPFRGYLARHPRPENLYAFFAHRLPLPCYPWGLAAGLAAGECLMEERPGDIERIAGRIGELMEDYRAGLTLACGPTPFLRTVREAALRLGSRAQLSLETRMACGVGACLGCVTRSGKGGHVQVCTCGPVFEAADVEI